MAESGLSTADLADQLPKLATGFEPTFVRRRKKLHRLISKCATAAGPGRGLFRSRRDPDCVHVIACNHAEQKITVSVGTFHTVALRVTASP
jgi:hypothetical protein